MEGGFVVLLWLFIIIWCVRYVLRKRAERRAEEMARAAEAKARREVEQQQHLARYNQLQRVVLACAKKEKGIVTPAAVVASSIARDRVTMAVAQRQLDWMVQNGHIEPHATESGVPPLVYVVPEFLTDATRRQIAGY